MEQMRHTFVSRTLIPSIRFMVLCSLLLGFLYPAVIIGVAQLLFPWQANGSFINHNNVRVGSHFIGQVFTDLRYFWGRPSATPEKPYNAFYSQGSNLGPSTLLRQQAIQTQISMLQSANSGINITIPFNLVTASGSGLDPDISPAAAQYQIFRIAKARQLPVETVARLIEENTVQRSLHLFGQPRVNVLQLNLALDRISAQSLPDIRNTHGQTP